MSSYSPLLRWRRRQYGEIKHLITLHRAAPPVAEQGRVTESFLRWFLIFWQPCKSSEPGQPRREVCSGQWTFNKIGKEI